MPRASDEHPLTKLCLCDTPCHLLCPEHEQDSPELRGRAYETLAMMYLNQRKLATIWAADSNRLSFLQDMQCPMNERENRIAFVYSREHSLREAIDAALAADQEEDA